MSFFKRSFVRLPRNQKFNYEPRYFDPLKEEIDERRDLTLKKGAFYKNSRRPLQGAFSDRNSFQRSQQLKSRQGQVIRTFVVLGVLLLLFALSFEKLDGILQALF